MPAPVRGKHSCGNGDRCAHNQGEESELKRRGVAFKNNLSHRRLKLEGLPKVAASELPQVMSILDMERQIQAKYMAQLRQLSCRGTLAQHLLARISRHNVNHEKNERENEPKRRQREEKSFEEIARHLR